MSYQLTMLVGTDQWDAGNVAPSDIALSNSSINERAGTNAVVGTLSAVDPNPGDTHVYTLVSGTGATDNALFNISGTSLRATNSLNYADAATRSVRIRATDQHGEFVEEAFTITINYVNQAPVNTVPGGQSVMAARTLTFSSGNGNAISVSDIESLTVTLAVSGGGTLTLGGTTGLSFSAGDGTADTTMTFSGTPSAINTALSGLTFAATMRSTAGSATLTLTTSDGVYQDVDTVAITITAYDPSLLSGYDADYDFGNAAVLFQDSGAATPVASLNDPIGRVNSAAGTSAPYFYAANNSYRPLWKAVSGGAGNGAKADGIDDRLLCSSATYFDFMHKTTGYTFVAAVAFTGADSGSLQTIFSANNDNAEVGVVLAIQESGAAVGAFYGWIGPNKIGIFGSAGNHAHGTTMISFVSAWQSGSTGNDFIARLAGVDIASAETSGTPSSSSSTSTPTLFSRPTGAYLLVGTVRRILIFRGRLSAATIAELESWLATL